MDTSLFYPGISEILNNIIQAPPQLPEDRMKLVRELGGYIRRQVQEGKPVRLNFICTHNSRRSHLGQIWAHVWGTWFGMESIQTYSGGMEVTAFHPNAIAALRKQGFVIETTDAGNNPKYSVSFSLTDAPAICWSKIFSDPANPSADFAAIMVCDSASEACPIVPGADVKIPLEFTDPKASDGTPQQEATYMARSLQIAGELYLAFKEGKRENVKT